MVASCSSVMRKTSQLRAGNARKSGDVWTMDDDLCMFQPPVRGCKHIVEGGYVPFRRHVLRDIILEASDVKCTFCSTAGQSWLCMRCHRCFCGDAFTAKGHLQEHHRSGTSHAAFLCLYTLRFYCCACASPVETLPLLSVYSLAHLAKHGTLPAEEVPWSAEEMEAVFAVGFSSLAEEYVSVSFTAPLLVAASGLEEVARRAAGDKVLDTIFGCIFGTALGDAVGLACEFQTPEQVSELYSSGDIVPFPAFKRNFHSNLWVEGDWTDDTDQMCLLLRSLVHCRGVHEADFALRLKRWVVFGFPELEDTCGLGVGQTVKSVTSHPDFVARPAEVAEGLWTRRGREAAANGAVMRTAPVGCVNWWNTRVVAENAAKFARTTHADDRCVASSVAASVVVALLMKESRAGRCSPGVEIIPILQEAHCIASNFISDAHFSTLEQHLSATTFEQLRLAEPGRIGYTLKCIGASFVGLQKASWLSPSANTFKSIISELTLQGGDADTNAAVTGGLLGAYIGYSALPDDWLEGLRYSEWLAPLALAYADLVVMTAPRDGYGGDR